MNRLSPCQLNLTLCNGLAIYRSSDWTLSFKISERENLTDTPIDLSGYTGKANIKKFLTDEEPIAQPSVDTYADGTVVVSLPAELTRNLICQGKTYNDPDTFQYEVILTDESTGENFRTLFGSVEVSPSAFDNNDN